MLSNIVFRSKNAKLGKDNEFVLARFLKINIGVGEDDSV